VNTATDITTARARRIRQKLSESDLAGKQQILLRLECGLDLGELRVDLEQSGRVRNPETRKINSTFRWGDYCRSDLGVHPDTASEYIRIANWSACNPEISAQLREQSDNWTQYIGLVALHRAESRPQRARRAPRKTTEQPAVVSTGISFKTAQRLQRLSGMCTDTGPEGETARNRVESLTGQSAEQFFESPVARGLVGCANSLSRENKQWLNTAAADLAKSLSAMAAVHSLDIDQLIADFGATVRESASESITLSL
jgi:hypothetical protein